MDIDYDPFPESENSEAPRDFPAPPRDLPEGIFLITEEEYYDLLMEQQEQM